MKYSSYEGCLLTMHGVNSLVESQRVGFLSTVENLSSGTSQLARILHRLDENPEPITQLLDFHHKFPQARKNALL